jgi:hypothetical protein
MVKTLSPKNNVRWTKSERKTMLEKLATYSKPTLGFKEVANALGRTPEAVSWQYYNAIKKYSKKKAVQTAMNKVTKSNILKLEFDIQSISISNNKLILEIQQN